MCKARLTSYNMSLQKEMGQPDYTGIITCMQQQKVLCPLGLGILFWPFHEVSCAPSCAPCWHLCSWRSPSGSSWARHIPHDKRSKKDGGRCGGMVMWAMQAPHLSIWSQRVPEAVASGRWRPYPALLRLSTLGQHRYGWCGHGGGDSHIGTVLAHTPPLFPITHALVHETKGWNERDR